jgi:hypothetical protein
MGSAPDGSPIFDLRRLEFPGDKRACELLIASSFVEMIAKVPRPDGHVLQLTDLKQNPEDGLDFSVTVNGVPADLELMEAAPLAGPYDKAPKVYGIGEYVSRLLTEIGKKERKYPSSTTRPVYLLVYVTHAPFTLSMPTIESMRYPLPDCYLGCCVMRK